ncbi:hypothetical protein [Sphingomicrobium lutaoense]|uniref:Uncharacterized protein n=1 Tax=Sphingomicrobium lutaoense TaxID=515949 RepID=A0A839Z129_9SPHN|nr:hypothetical protein [Sphingomicrobium lutaoense]MBB3763757.1 hypothetical protein [Sphingomicrobium lutaoense]
MSSISSPDEAFDRIEESILPCLAMMMESLIEASAGLGKANPKALAAELQVISTELESLIDAVERRGEDSVLLGPDRSHAA